MREREGGREMHVRKFLLPICETYTINLRSLHRFSIDWNFKEVGFCRSKSKIAWKDKNHGRRSSSSSSCTKWELAKSVLFVCLVTRHASKTRRRCAMQHQQALLEDHIISRHSLLSVSQSPPILQRHKHHFLLVLHHLLQTSILKSELTAYEWKSFLS